MIKINFASTSYTIKMIFTHERISNNNLQYYTVYTNITLKNSFCLYNEYLYFGHSKFYMLLRVQYFNFMLQRSIFV